MSGLLALLDDVAGIAKVAAASVDDVASQAVKAGAKAAGAVIDDAAVTPKYLKGFAPARELPIIWRIARGSFINKLVFLLPIGLALANFAPWMIPPLLMLGGAYLCFEGAEKIVHSLGFGHHDTSHGDKAHDDPAHLEEERVSGAIKTDFILSAEIMTIALAAIPESNFWMEAATLAFIAIGITVAVYGAVALIVKADDVGLYMAQNARTGLFQGLGRGIVRFMPTFMWLLTVVGTAAMLWVGGSIILHAMSEMGWPVIYDWIHHIAKDVAASAGDAKGFVKWAVTAGLDGVLGLAIGLLLIPIGTKVITPVWQKVTKLNPLG
jgi:predicted DNA repair protein MutK